MKSIRLRMSAAQEAGHLDNLDRADERTLALARLLYRAAFPERPALGLTDAIPPLYLRQATTLAADATLRSQFAAILVRFTPGGM